ncbi:MAG: aldo/keto reductase [Blastocatellia bacterium]
MNGRTFGDTGKPVSEVGLGCWQLGGGDWGEVSDQQAYDIMARAIAAGVNFFDTADVYGGGRSETLIGHFLQATKHDIFVATKLGRKGLYPDKYSEATLRAATEESLARLHTDALELTQLHCLPTGVMREGDVFEWLRRLQQEGKIKRFGASVESMEEALICLEQPGLCSLQIIFNIFRQKPIHALFDLARAKNVALIIRLPLASGLLGGKMNAATSFAASDHRAYNRDGQFFNVGETFAGLPYDTGLALVEELRPLVPAGMTMAQWAMRWILDFPAVTTVIPGATRPEQVTANVAASALPSLDETTHRRIQQFYETQVAAHIRGPY